MKRLLISAALCALGSFGAMAWADSWDLSYYQVETPDRVFGGCFLFFERMDPSVRSRGMTLIVTDHSIAKRREFGLDPYRPRLSFVGNPLQGPKREAIFPEGGVVSVRRGTFDDRNLFHVSSASGTSGFEYRVRYRVDGGPVGDAWVTPSGSVDIDETRPDHPRLVLDSMRIAYTWVDWPDELFETDERRSLLMHHPGLATLNDTTRPFDHLLRWNVHYSFTGGKTAMSRLKGCVERHVEAGRLDAGADDDEAARALDRKVLWGL